MPRNRNDPVAAAALLFRDLRRCNDKSIRKTGDINVSDLADCIEKALENEITRRGIRLAIAEFIGTALDGGLIKTAKWKPLQTLKPRNFR